MDGPYSISLAAGAGAGATATAACCIFVVWNLRSNPKKKKMTSGFDCTCDHRTAENGLAEMAAERHDGGSMMEQLVPEIKTHAFSYLDHVSLCRLSMTNSAMRRAANDDGPWKALYRKDFTTEQDNVTPINGWKSYYATTKAIVSINAEFYDIIKERSLQAMSRFWLDAEYVKCIHGSGELFIGYSAVINSWDLAFVEVDQDMIFEIRDVRARVMSEMAWVTMNLYVAVDSGPFHVTNIYEFHNGRWFMVLHHSSVMLGDGDVDDNPGQQNIFG